MLGLPTNWRAANAVPQALLGISNDHRFEINPLLRGCFWSATTRWWVVSQLETRHHIDAQCGTQLQSLHARAFITRTVAANKPPSFFTT